jgi:hypothetical protein
MTSGLTVAHCWGHRFRSKAILQGFYAVVESFPDSPHPRPLQIAAATDAYEDPTREEDETQVPPVFPLLAQQRCILALGLAGALVYRPSLLHCRWLSPTHVSLATTTAALTIAVGRPSLLHCRWLSPTHVSLATTTAALTIAVGFHNQSHRLPAGRRH